jgi:hypothetical protein
MIIGAIIGNSELPVACASVQFGLELGGFIQ